MSNSPEATQREPGLALELFAVGFDEAVEIGYGGFGVVYRCRQEHLERVVAVKVLSADPNPENLARFMREQRAMGRISGHPNIVELYQVGVTRGNRPFLVMPYHGHGSLEARIRTGGPLPWDQTLRIGIKIAGALESAHRAGILHRDVKPANILLTDYDEPQLSDFGIARIIGGFETAAEALMCSPAYTAPEVLQGLAPSVMSDVYSLGATLFCALTGHAAFERRSGEQVVAQFLRITSEPLPDLRESDFPEMLCAAIENAMHRSAERRPGSAAEFGEQLRGIQRLHCVEVDRMHILRTPEASADAIEPAALHRFRARTPPAPLTKFRPPDTGPHAVRRERLLDALRSGRDQRLSLVHGPAGFGKSTLVAQWREELVAGGVAVAWLTVDNDDNNVAWFLSHLVEAVSRVRPDVTTDLAQALEENGEPVRRFVLTSLINRLHESGEPAVVVVDDWHLVNGSATVSAMEFLLDNGCHHLRFVVAGRSGSKLPVGRMRVRDELCEINPSALGFDMAESRTFFADRVRGPLLDSEIEELRLATDGWVAALQLASLSLRDNGCVEGVLNQLESGTDSLGDYLTENVLDSLDPATRDFLLVTAVPDRVCGALASALAGVPDGQARLEMAAARDLFLSASGDDRRWYRYHSLFARTLCQRLVRDDPERVTSLHHTAATWFRQHHLFAEAVEHLLMTDQPGSAVQLLETDCLYLLERSQMSTLLSLVDKLPVEQVRCSPRLQLAIGWANTELEHRDAANDAHRQVLRLLDALDLPPARRADLLVEADVLRACVLSAADRVAGVKELLAECFTAPASHPAFVVSMAALLDSIADVLEFRFDQAVARQNWAAPYHNQTTGPYLVAYGYCIAGIAKVERLDIPGATLLYCNAIQLTRDAGNTQSQHARLARSLLAEVFHWQGQVAKADGLLDQTFDFAAVGGAPDFMIRHYCLSARVLALRGDRAAAADRLDEGVRAAEAVALPRLLAAVDLERARLDLPTRPGFVPAIRGESRQPLDGVEQLTADYNDETTITLLLRNQDHSSAQLACEWAGERVRRLDGTSRELAQLYAQRLWVACLWSAGRTRDAQSALIPLVGRCAGDGLTQFLIDGGTHVTAALTALREFSGPSLQAATAAFIDTALNAM